MLDRLLHHGTEVRRERERARAAGEAPDFARLCREWGGVSIVYRRAMEESPAYRLNHEEIIKALEEGHFLRREPGAGGGRPRRQRASEGRAVPPVARRRGGRGAGAIVLGRGGHDPEHHLREGAPRHVSRWTSAGVSSSPTTPCRARTGGGRSSPRPRRTRPPSSPATPGTGGSSRSSATTTPPSTATSSRRWPRPRRDTFRSPPRSSATAASGPPPRLRSGTPSAARSRTGSPPASSPSTG